MCSKNKVTERNKHIRVKQHKIREYITEGDINVKFISSDENSADMLTKAVSGPKVIYLSQKAGLNPITA